ncbi:hypothetical protein SNOG_15306 [Parastagonospora nodorum SN15]|uniref:Uncharacterized protein n=1 Tax=Phaeosphaeria nodorum (strain SN15 / ATCC MYA-4574 / FGSC 10173) TaxID=321614 RepID=Q0TYN6_PHANO|nr:hypothetical protein SNOG_15306 [Parastagonospora nodorum SN15]EAT77239.1 hypothetical protein SNOG_15306 [Parastagonospora nodorum SN15]
MLNPLLPLSIHALNSTPSSERILQLPEPFSEDTHPRISHFTLSPPPHLRLSTSTDSPLQTPNQVQMESFTPKMIQRRENQDLHVLP